MKCEQPSSEVDEAKGPPLPPPSTTPTSLLHLVATARAMAAASSAPPTPTSLAASDDLRAAVLSAAAAAVAASPKKNWIKKGSDDSTPASPKAGAEQRPQPLVNGKDEKLENTPPAHNDTGTSSCGTAKTGVSSSGSSSSNAKRVNNNNTSSYCSGEGSLKFFKDGRFLLELTHTSNTDRGSGWIPARKNVYYPPLLAGGERSASTAASSPSTAVKAESTASTQSVSDSASNADASPTPSPFVAGPGCCHRSKTTPRRLRLERLPKEVALELSFGLKPPPCIVSIRKKVRGLKLKRRRPYDKIMVGSLMLKMEAQAVTSRPKRRPLDIDRIKRASRLESFVTKVQNMPQKKKNPMPLVQIQAWSSSSTSSKSSTNNKTKSISSIPSVPPVCEPSVTTKGGVTKVKCELFKVTETCTAASMPNASPYHSASKSKSKADKSNNARDSHPNSPLVSAAGHHVMGKTMPITPTVARIKSEAGGSGSPILAASSLISPDHRRVKIEIGATPGSNRPMTMTSSSPVALDPRDPHFLSPRKRLLQNFENGVAVGGGPAIKRHRLSTDSRGSAGSSEGLGGSNSPHLRTNSPFHLPMVASSPPRPIASRSNSFSIDSIISRDERDTSNLVKPMAIPASPARDLKPVDYPMDEGGLSRSPTPSAIRSSPVRVPAQRMASPPHVPISPYVQRGGLDPGRLDPRLAHLAGVAADPRLGLTPTLGLGFPYNAAAASAVMSSYFSPLASQAASLAAATQLAAVSGLWTPPVSTRTLSMATPTSKRPPSPNKLSVTLSSSSPSRRSSHPIPSVPSALMGAWPGQYRGSPKLEAAMVDSNASGDTPLNLSTKR